MKNIIEKHVFRFFWIVFAFLVMLFSLNMTYNRKEDSFHAYFELNSYDGIVHFDGEEAQKNLLLFECDLPDVNIARPYIAISNVQPKNIFIESKIYSFEDSVEVVDINGDSWYLIPMPNNSRGSELRLDFSSDFIKNGNKLGKTNAEYEIMPVPRVCFGTRNVLLNNITISGNLHIIASSVLFCVAVIILLTNAIFKILYKIETHISYFGFGFMGFSLWIFCESAYAMSYFNGYSIDIIKCTSIFIIPVLLFRYISLEFPKTYKMFFVLLSLFHFILVLGSVIGIMEEQFTFYEIEQFLWFMFICSLLECICCLSVEASDNKRMQSLYVGITIIFFTFFIYLLFYNFQPMVAVISLVAGSTLLIIYNLFVFVARGVEIYRQSLERKNMEQQLNEQVKHYRVLETKDSEYRKLRHDMKNHWQVVKLLLENDKKEEALNYTKEIQNQLEFTGKRYFINTGNAFLDAILTSKIEYAANNNIQVDTEIMIVKEMKIDMMDNSIIFGNILDNALEACQKIDGEKRIFVKMLYKKGMLVCCFLNSVQEGKKLKDGFATSKDNAENHGYGIGNIKAAVEKYGGKLNIKVSDRSFEVSFVLMGV